MDGSEYLFKVIVIGEANVGKTSVIKRYVNNEFSNKYKYTIGVDFALKQLQWDENTMVRLQLWDIAGQERFGIMTHVYYKEATAACVVFDISSRRSFQAVERWKNDVDQKVRLPNGDPVPCVLFANKVDLIHNVDFEEIDKFAKDHGFIGWYKTSAKVNEGIDAGLEALILHIFKAIDVRVLPAPRLQEGLKVQNSKKIDSKTDESKPSCCMGKPSGKPNQSAKPVVNRVV